MKNGKALLGILAGAGAGALLGILFAPSTGKGTRQQISKTTRKVTNNLSQKLDETLDNIKVLFSKSKEEATEFIRHAKAKGEKLKKENGVEIL